LFELSQANIARKQEEIRPNFDSWYGSRFTDGIHNWFYGRPKSTPCRGIRLIKEIIDYKFIDQIGSEIALWI